ncbi:predicted protein [Histoplasma mississippiense (nom. inval.)]|uniref:predicted protein n=1 Tax=Ajellomyces capsulatus (strain NAm1 / WU24) TaxID=2059318 RepID=UPI000157D1C2|nr:predicted protein [Histoplasma mississippiense (nom. inval.)]EDN10926.1 predicted protein [Histoplasma mississippiense (nom. inval.)]
MYRQIGEESSYEEVSLGGYRGSLQSTSFPSHDDRSSEIFAQGLLLPEYAPRIRDQYANYLVPLDSTLSSGISEDVIQPIKAEWQSIQADGTSCPDGEHQISQHMGREAPIARLPEKAEISPPGLSFAHTGKAKPREKDSAIATATAVNRRHVAMACVYDPNYRRLRFSTVRLSKGVSGEKASMVPVSRS